MSDGGKGSRPRPYSVDQKTFDNNWDKIFGKKNQPNPDVDQDQDIDPDYPDGENNS